jgi:hypothetical protein
MSANVAKVLHFLKVMLSSVNMLNLNFYSAI